MLGRLYLATLLVITSSSVFCGSAMSEQFGRFEGSVKVEWLDDGREMKTISRITYIDPNGLTWTVPAGTKTDGASTPKATWPMYPPFAGKYRKAALVHDYYCEKRTRSWEDVHNMFYFALRASGMDVVNSKIMWSAVYMHGPRWVVATKRSLHIQSDELTPEQAQKQFEMMADWVRKTNPSRREIERAIQDRTIHNMPENTQHIR